MAIHVRMVAKLIAQPLRENVQHYRGLPPELTSGEDLRQKLLRPALLLIEALSDGIFLFRIASDGQFSGDTWHEKIEDAKAQASFEFGNSISEWVTVPDDVEDPVAYGLSSK